MALLRPKEWVEKPIEEHMKFILDAEQSLIDQYTKLVQEQPMLLKVEARNNYQNK